MRANPDLDEWVYKCRKGGVMVLNYRSPTPNSISDILSGSAMDEHPYEHMAYYVASLYNIPITQEEL
jgi:hypothetical protein